MGASHDGPLEMAKRNGSELFFGLFGQFGSIFRDDFFDEFYSNMKLICGVSVDFVQDNRFRNFYCKINSIPSSMSSEWYKSVGSSTEPNRNHML